MNKSRFDAIFIFEVLEHLINPLLFLESLKNYITKDTLVFISYPEHFIKQFWSNNHFNEYDKKRFEYLINEAGYKIIKHKSILWLWCKFRNYFTGIRPILRLVTGYWILTIFKKHYYILRLK